MTEFSTERFSTAKSSQGQSCDIKGNAFLSDFLLDSVILHPYTACIKRLALNSVIMNVSKHASEHKVTFTNPKLTNIQ